MILFVGEQDKGWFIPETAEKKNEKCEYSGFVSSLEELSKSILQGSYSEYQSSIPTQHRMRTSEWLLTRI